MAAERLPKSSIGEMRLSMGASLPVFYNILCYSKHLLLQAVVGVATEQITSFLASEMNSSYYDMAECTHGHALSFGL